jgi:hypothetical protein
MKSVKKKTARKDAKKLSPFLKGVVELIGADRFSMLSDQVNDAERFRQICAGAEKSGLRLYPEHEERAKAHGMVQVIFGCGSRLTDADREKVKNADI